MLALLPAASPILSFVTAEEGWEGSLTAGPPAGTSTSRRNDGEVERVYYTFSRCRLAFVCGGRRTAAVVVVPFPAPPLPSPFFLSPLASALPFGSSSFAARGSVCPIAVYFKRASHLFSPPVAHPKAPTSLRQTCLSSRRPVLSPDFPPRHKARLFLAPSSRLCGHKLAVVRAGLFRVRPSQPSPWVVLLTLPQFMAGCGGCHNTTTMPLRTVSKASGGRPSLHDLAWLHTSWDAACRPEIDNAVLVLLCRSLTHPGRAPQPQSYCHGHVQDLWPMLRGGCTGFPARRSTPEEEGAVDAYNEAP